jgi:uncharacterized membrane protein
MLQLFGIDTAGFNTWKLVAGTQQPWWLLTLLAMALLLAVWLASRGLRTLPRATRFLLLLLRLLAALLIFVLVLEPSVELQATVRERGRVAVLVDASASMALDDGGQSRWLKAQAKLAALRTRLTRVAADFEVDFYHFDAALAQITDPDAAFKMAPTGTQTNFVAALEALQNSSSQRRLGGVIVISDGADTAGLATSLEPAKAALSALHAPLFGLVVGDASRFRDVAVELDRGDGFAFVRNSVDVEALVYAHNMKPQRVAVSLREGQQTLAVTEVELGPEPVRVKFSLKPQQTGKRALSIEVPVLDGEAIADNNRQAFVLDVMRDRIRVLQVAGRPSWDERFLRLMLKANPSVDLISFFILRSHADAPGTAEELSLIPFPTEELFTKELSSFDIVIMQNFDYRPYQMGIYLGNIRDFVLEHGGGLVMVGGDLSFSEGAYANTPLADALPVVLSPSPGQYQRQSFRPRLSKAGLQHPILDMGREGAEALLAQLPALEGFNRCLGLASGAQVLLEHPFERSADGGAPLVAVREVGRGRTLAVTSDDTWFWGLPDAGAGGRGMAHRRFWANALRWLIRDPAMARVRISVARRAFRMDDVIQAQVRVFDTSYQGLPETPVTIELRREGSAGPEMVSTQLANADREGDVQVEFGRLPAGTYRLRAFSADANGAALGDDEEVIVVHQASVERSDPRPRPELLQGLARASGGVLLGDADDLQANMLRDTARVQVLRAQRVSIWDNMWTLLVLAAVLGAEWLMRRRRGLA